MTRAHAKAPPAPFDAVAETYDGVFSNHPVGLVLRRAVWRHLDTAFQPGMTVLDLGCGTGEDALHMAERGVDVIGVDASAAMVRLARAKVVAAGMTGRVTLCQADLSRPPPSVLGKGAVGWGPAHPRTFDGAVANFGVLNCLPSTSLGQLGRELACRMAPGGRFIAVVMGPSCAWEVAWYALRGDVRRATRRLRHDGTTADFGSGSLAVLYPGHNALAAALAPGFRPEYAAAIGSVLPPTYACGWLGRRPRVLTRLTAIDRRIERWPLAVRLADHYLACLERTPDG